MSEEFIKIMDEIAKRSGQVIDWTSANVLPQIQLISEKYIHYQMFYDVVLMLCATGIAIFCMYLIKRFSKALEHLYKKQFDDKAYETLPAKLRYELDNMIVTKKVHITVCQVIIIICIILFIVFLLNFAQCIIFPEELIIRELQTYM